MRHDYIAKFSNGKTKTLKGSTKNFTHAWCAIFIGGYKGAEEVCKMGFSSSYDGCLVSIQREACHTTKARTMPRFTGDELFPAGKTLFTQIVGVHKKKSTTKQENV